MSALFTLGNTPIGPATNPYVIAEVGINHNGYIETALKMIDAAKVAGADAVKFQTFSAEEFCGDPDQQFTYFSEGKQKTESMLEMFKRVELQADDWKIIKDHAEAIGITFFSTPQNVSDLNLLLPLGITAIKVGSDDLTNLPLIRKYSEHNLPMILSSGMADLSEVHRALEAAGWFDSKPVALLVCTSQYPTPPDDVNIQRVTTLRAAFPGLLVGFSDHSQGNEAAIMAVALGAKIFEKHFTLDHDMVGPDHWFSLDPQDLKRWIDSIRDAHRMLGTGIVTPSKKEIEMREIARRSVVVIADVRSGEILDEGNIGLRRPGIGLSPEFLPAILGRIAKRSIGKGSMIHWSDLA